MVEVKVCGITSVADAIGCLEAGVDALGLNFWSGTPRRVSVEVARTIVEAVGGRAPCVGVFVDLDIAETKRIMRDTGVSWAQLHGEEPPEAVAALLPNAYKALGVAEGEDAEAVLARARRYPGEHLLLDARVPGAMPGGTGVPFDWAVAARVAAERKLTLAGGLRPENVADAVRAVHPHRVDVASGVESRPGVKDLERVRAFVEAAKSA